MPVTQKVKPDSVLRALHFQDESTLKAICSAGGRAAKRKRDIMKAAFDEVALEEREKKYALIRAELEATNYHTHPPETYD